MNIIVITLHLFFIMFLLITPHKIPPRQTHHIKIRTIQPKTLVKNQNQTMTSAKALSPPPSLSSIPIKKGVKKTPSPPKQTATKKENLVKKMIRPSKKKIEVEMWDEIDQTLAKIEKKRYPHTHLTEETAKIVPFLPHETIEAEKSIEVQMIHFLHETLHLPEIGEVKVQLTVQKDGTVSKVIVMDSDSRKNKIYLQEHLLFLRFPMQFNQDKTWTLTFYNEI